MQIKIIRNAFRLICAVLFIFSLCQIFLSDPARSADTGLPRADEIAEREKRLKAREEEIDRKLKEMEKIRQEISGEINKQHKQHEEHLVKMVSVYETMTPKNAAAVFETMDDELAIDILKKMDDKKVAKVMNMLKKERSALLSEKLTGYYKPEVLKTPFANQGQVKADNSLDSSKERMPASKGEVKPVSPSRAK